MLAMVMDAIFLRRGRKMNANSRHIGIDVLAAKRIYHCEMLADDRPHVIVVAILNRTNRVDAPGEVFDGLDQLTIAAQGELSAVEGGVQFEDAPKIGRAHV